MFDMKAMAMQMISKNPNVANNPQAQQYIQLIQNGNNAQGEQIANNICKTYGVTKEQALDMAMKFFGMKR